MNSVSDAMEEGLIGLRVKSDALAICHENIVCLFEKL